MAHRAPPLRTWMLAAVSAVLVSGCGGSAASDPGTSGATGVPDVQLAAPEVAPIPTVEPTCMASQPSYGDTAELLMKASVVIRGTAIGSRDHDMHPLPPAQTDPPPKVTAEAPPNHATALQVRVREVIRGEVAVGEVLEVNQGQCTARPLPVGPDTDYVLVLESVLPGIPLNQLNDFQAAWQVSDQGDLVPVDPRNDLGVDSIDDLIAAPAGGSTQP